MSIIGVPVLQTKEGGGLPLTPGWGANRSHHLSHTDSVRLRLLGTVRFVQFLEEWGAVGALNVLLGSPPSPLTHTSQIKPRLVPACIRQYLVVGLI